jgi:hypothetical protein
MAYIICKTENVNGTLPLEDTRRIVCMDKLLNKKCVMDSDGLMFFPYTKIAPCEMAEILKIRDNFNLFYDIIHTIESDFENLDIEEDD